MLPRPLGRRAVRPVAAGELIQAEAAVGRIPAQQQAVEVVRPAVVQLPMLPRPLERRALRPAVAGNSVEVAVGRVPVEQLAAEVVRPAAVVECLMPPRPPRWFALRPAVARVDN